MKVIEIRFKSSDRCHSFYETLKAMSLRVYMIDDLLHLHLTDAMDIDRSTLRLLRQHNAVDAVKVLHNR